MAEVKIMNVRSIAKRAKDVSKSIAIASTEEKNYALEKMAELLQKHKRGLADTNIEDIEAGKKLGIPPNILRRLVFDEKKVEGRITALKKIIDLPDPVGQIREVQKRPNGLIVGRMRVPIGVIMMIYEARPHVTVNAGAFALKSGNAIILKGGKEASKCNSLLGNLWREALNDARLPEDAVQCITATHEEVAEFLQLRDYIDLVIPRGGKGLISSVVERSRIPVIKHFEGICHVYIDDDADMVKAERITLNSKLLMPEVCNAAETLLVSRKRINDVMRVIESLKREGVEIRGCEEVQKVAEDIVPATEEDWRTEYLDKIISVKIVNGLAEAIEHINRYGSEHTDTIITENYANAKRFLREVDSAVVLVNASTMFDDGEELGLGAEVGISTEKLHARGPMGLEELTSYKFVVLGEDHIKK